MLSCPTLPIKFVDAKRTEEITQETVSKFKKKKLSDILYWVLQTKDFWWHPVGIMLCNCIQGDLNGGRLSWTADSY